MHEANGHGANTSLSYNTCIRSTVDRLGFIPLKRAFWGGSKLSREVVVLAAVVEVVVHDDGSHTRVVVELDGANVLEGSRGTWGLRTCRSRFLRR